MGASYFYSDTWSSLLFAPARISVSNLVPGAWTLEAPRRNKKWNMRRFLGRDLKLGLPRVGKVREPSSLSLRARSPLDSYLELEPFLIWSSFIFCDSIFAIFIFLLCFTRLKSNSRIYAAGIYFCLRFFFLPAPTPLSFFVNNLPNLFLPNICTASLWDCCVSPLTLGKLVGKCQVLDLWFCTRVYFVRWPFWGEG